MRLKNFQILNVEDSEADRDLLNVLFAECEIETEVHFAKDGIEGSDFVFKRNKYLGAPTPDLILMDINLPLKNGKELLAELKSNDETSTIPVVMFSTSKSEAQETYRLGANGFISKPVDLKVYEEVIKTLVDYWFKYIVLPVPSECTKVA